MNRIAANLLIVIAVLLLAWAYRLKRADKLPLRNANRRPSGPGRLEQLWLELCIVFSSARFGLLGV
jgi:hypothetical protein